MVNVSDATLVAEMVGDTVELRLMEKDIEISLVTLEVCVFDEDEDNDVVLEREVVVVHVAVSSIVREKDLESSAVVEVDWEYDVDGDVLLDTDNVVLRVDSGETEFVSVAVMVRDSDGSSDGVSDFSDVALGEEDMDEVLLAVWAAVCVGSSDVEFVGSYVCVWELLSDIVKVTVEENINGSDITTPPGRQCPP